MQKRLRLKKHLLYWKKLATLPDLERRVIGQAFRHYRRWGRTLDSNSISDRLPWITFEAIDFAGTIVTPDSKVFEWGSGGSTLFWADRAAEVVSVEHDAAWYELCRYNTGISSGPKIDYMLIPPDKPEEGSTAVPDEFVSTAKQYEDCDFRCYAECIDRFPDEYFDIVVVDGRVRAACICRGMAKVSPGGWLVLDNSERIRYLAGNEELTDPARWEERSFFGPIPYTTFFSKTSFFRKLK